MKRHKVHPEEEGVKRGDRIDKMAASSPPWGREDQYPIRKAQGILASLMGARMGVVMGIKKFN